MLYIVNVCVCVQDEFELHESDKAVIAAGAPCHWRLRYQQLSSGAFQGLHVSPVVVSLHMPAYLLCTSLHDVVGRVLRHVFSRFPGKDRGTGLTVSSLRPEEQLHKPGPYFHDHCPFCWIILP